ncbi:MAG: cobyrinate a,c-diamide synthase [Deltaproteobacteria bacterium]|nr:cobyrinate a,c-diamide synthase [Deltaproteobacteria bacterium]MBW2067441.1 cobyrinate a,c-diamide synthase [Deltaproteobacteria bacterium]
MVDYGFVIAGTHSGCGKTTLSLALMAYLSELGMKVQPFKVGPDFIDPGLHELVTGVRSRNLDGWMLTQSYNTALFGWASREKDVAIVEGVMGIYDGFDGKSEAGSTAQMAKWLDLPVVLVVDCRSMARSVAALVHGFVDFDKDLRWVGIVLNRVGSEKHYEYLKEALAPMSDKIPVLGWIPAERELTLPERHLGLVTAEETPLDAFWKERALKLIENHIDVQMLLRRSILTGAGTVRFVPEKPWANIIEYGRIENVNIAVPRDSAFCFYYADNLDILKDCGAELVEFSPLAGETIPYEASALYVGGGYPEVHADKLVQNRSFFERIRAMAVQGCPIYAECGGLMILSKYIKTKKGNDEVSFSMAGLFPFGVRMLPRRRALGYVVVRFLEDCILGGRNQTVRGHEFHYSDVEGEIGGVKRVFEVKKNERELARMEGYSIGQVLASYVHQHWGSNPHVPVTFLQKARAASEAS